MAVRFRPSEGWVFETAEEAAAFYRQISSNSNGVAVPPVSRDRKAVAGQSVDPTSAALTDSAKKLILVLLDHPDGVSGHALAEAIGVEPKGVGSVMGTISRWGEHHDLTRKEMILKKRTKDTSGKAVRILKMTNSFRKKVQGGAFAELR